MCGESMFSLSEGNGIFINSKILHKFYSSDETVIPNFLCMPSFLAPENSLIYQKYIQPIVSSSLSYLILNGENLWQGEALEIMKQIFSAQDREVDGELLTSVLMQKLWLIIYENIDKTCMEEQVGNSGFSSGTLAAYDASFCTRIMQKIFLWRKLPVMLILVKVRC